MLSVESSALYFPESLETVAFQYGFKGVAYLMADISQGSVHLFLVPAFGFPAFSVSAPLRKPKSVSSSPTGGHGTAMLVGVTDSFFPVRPHRH